MRLISARSVVRVHLSPPPPSIYLIQGDESCVCLVKRRRPIEDWPRRPKWLKAEFVARQTPSANRRKRRPIADRPRCQPQVDTKHLENCIEARRLRRHKIEKNREKGSCKSTQVLSRLKGRRTASLGLHLCVIGSGRREENQRRSSYEERRVNALAP